MASPLSPNELLLKLLKEKAVLKQDVYRKTLEVFGQLQSTLKEMQSELQSKIKKIDSSITIEYRDKSDFEAELKIAGDTIVFVMHTNIFNFDKDHNIWKTSYVQQDQTRAYCGMICMYNFLADSFKYNRGNDVGYLIARLFLNKEKHYFVEGKRQLGFLYNDFDHAQVDKQAIRSVLESAILYCLDFDLYSPPYDEIKQITVSEINEASANFSIKTGKRLGFRFQADSDQPD